MKPPLFDYVRPRTLDEAIQALVAGGDDAKVLAGGQSLVPMLNLRLAAPTALVDVCSLDLGAACADGSSVKVPATTTYAELLERSELLRLMPLVGDCLPLIGHVAIRNRGTVGGSIAHADPLAELCTAAVTLGARVMCHSSRGERVVDAEALLEGPYMTTLDFDEIITAVAWPAHPAWGTAYEELAMRAGDFAIVGVAAALHEMTDGTVADIRLGISGMGGVPSRLREAEALLQGQPLTSHQVERAAEIAAAAGQPHSDIHASAQYRRSLAAELTRRALVHAHNRKRSQ